jgi:sugar/nucleoside kinase (ribokinase family)
VSVDVAVATTAFVDLTFVGLEAVPRPGQERHARDLLRSPGGGAITAVGAARLGLNVALASPLGADPEGREMLRTLLEERVTCAGGETERSAVSVVMPAEGDRAFATFDPGAPVSAEILAALAPRAVVVGLDSLQLAPEGAWAYVTTGDADAAAYAGRLPAALNHARAIIVNEPEALLLTGASDVEAAAHALAEHAATAVVTLGPGGAVAAGDGELWRADAPQTEVVDPTGAGDLFTAAYVWADLDGAQPGDRLGWATLYAALSVGVPTGIAGAARLDELLSAAAKEKA